MEVFERFLTQVCYWNMGSRLWTLLVEAGYVTKDGKGKVANELYA